MKEKEVDLCNKKLNELNEEAEELTKENNRLDRECEKSQAEYKDLCEKLDGSCSRNKDLSCKLKNLENTLRTTEVELDQATIKREGLRKENSQLVGDNKVLNAEIDECLLQILEYERVNKDLQKEVENFIACDEEARSLLNRKDSMRGLLEQVAGRLAKTEEQIAHLR